MALPILDGNQTATTLSTILTGGAHIPAHTVVSLGSQAISDISNAVSSVQVGGTVTANVAWQAGQMYPFRSDGDSAPDLGICVAFQKNNYGAAIVGDNFPLPISGTVTANVLNLPIANNGDEFPMDGPRLAVQLVDISSQAISILPVSGTVTVGNSVTIGSLPAISGTVTANNPSGALTTRFGSVATANLAFITSAVTNTNRKYLLAQNISAGTVTIGIGFSPTTTQGIQLTAGGGLTFDAFCPTGAVYWLGAVTGAAFTILEG